MFVAHPFYHADTTAGRSRSLNRRLSRLDPCLKLRIVLDSPIHLPCMVPCWFVWIQPSAAFLSANSGHRLSDCFPLRRDLRRRHPPFGYVPLYSLFQPTPLRLWLTACCSFIQIIRAECPCFQARSPPWGYIKHPIGHLSRLTVFRASRLTGIAPPPRELVRSLARLNKPGMRHPVLYLPLVLVACAPPAFLASTDPATRLLAPPA